MSLNSRPDLKLTKMIETHVSNIAENANEHSTMLKELKSLSQGNQQKIVKPRDRYEALSREVIADCVQRRVFRDMNVKSQP